MDKNRVLALPKTRQLDSGSYPDYNASSMAKLDLEPIIAKLCHPTRGLGWKLERAVFASEQYRRWLWLNARYEAEHLSPSQDVDHVWHMHILDTRKYAEDCEAMFGDQFLHHNPYAGWESENAEAEHQVNYRRTKDLFTKHFGVELLGATGLCDSGYCDKDIGEGRNFWRPDLSDIGTGIIAA